MQEEDFFRVVSLARARVAQHTLVALGPALGMSLKAVQKWKQAREALAGLVEILLEEVDVQGDGPIQSEIWGA